MITLPFIANYAMLANMPTNDEALIGATEAASDLGVSKDTLIRMIARGDITPVHKLPGDNGAYLFHRADVERLAEAKVAPTTEAASA